jgi:hypothetical protein
MHAQRHFDRSIKYTRQRFISGHYLSLIIRDEQLERFSSMSDINDLDNTTTLLTCIDRFRTLRLMAQVFGVEELEKIGLLGEEIASKSALAHTQFRMKNCLDALWDALTTVKFIFLNGIANSSEELQFLIGRLEKQLRYVGTLESGESIPELTIEIPKDWIFEPIE